MAKKADEVVRKEIADCTDINGQVEVERKGKAVKVWPVDAKALLDNEKKGYKLTGVNVAPIVPGVKPEPEKSKAGKPKAGKPRAEKSKAATKDK